MFPAFSRLWFAIFALHVQGAVIPPPWADPKVNPCALRPRGWQLIYWPPDGRCYKIFQVGYPCPETLELSPAISTRLAGVKAECRCPPNTSMYDSNGRCYELFSNGPCQRGQYFAPVKESATKQGSKIRRGICKKTDTCASSNQVFWPVDGQCYKKFTQGPCPKGQLLTLNANDLATCECSNNDDMKIFFWEPRQLCYEHFTRGPCQEKGHLFLPDGKCDCHSKLPHYHEESGQCYELGSIGPCKQGHLFKVKNPRIPKATCACKEGHIFWLGDGKCYRPYTQGPCPPTKIIVNSSSCIAIPCGKGTLYFPDEETCYRIGSQGPCPLGQVVTFDFRTRPSVDGISYNGICGCTGPLLDNGNCLKEKRSTKSCNTGMVLFKNRCFKLYSQGVCGDGQWLVPQRRDKMLVWQENVNRTLVKCDCKPGYRKVSSDDGISMRCEPPTVSLANYLNKHYSRNS